MFLSLRALNCFHPGGSRNLITLHRREMALMLKRTIGDEEEPPSPRTRSRSRINGDDVSSSVHYGTVDELRLLVSKRKRETERSCCGWQSIRTALVAAVHLLVACAITLIAHAFEHLGDSVIIALQKRRKRSRYTCGWISQASIQQCASYFILAYIYYAVEREARASLPSAHFLLNACTRLLKWLIDIMVRQGRPFWISSRIHMWHCPSAYGFPSGHACSGSYSLSLPRSMLPRPTSIPPLSSTLFFAFILLTRLYVGTHYPHSLSGIALGVLMVTTISAKGYTKHQAFCGRCRGPLTSLVDTIGRRLVLAAIAGRRNSDGAHDRDISGSCYTRKALRIS